MVEKLGVRPNDYEPVEVRQHLTADQTLEWVDQDGDRLEMNNPFGYLTGPRFLRRVTQRRLTEVERARQVAAERQAA